MVLCLDSGLLPGCSKAVPPLLVSALIQESWLVKPSHMECHRGKEDRPLQLK